MREDRLVNGCVDEIIEGNYLKGVTQIVGLLDRLIDRDDRPE